MKNPHLASEGAGKHSEVAASRIVAAHAARNPDPDRKIASSLKQLGDLGSISNELDSSHCPYGAECRHWIVDEATETANCGHCYQTFNRAELASILAGK